ncbi:MAG: TorF family putative porin [Steroidobacteraceae bacterium]
MLLTLVCAAAHAQGLHGALGASTDDEFRGISQSDGDPSAQADLHVTATHWYGGGSAEAVRGGASGSRGPELIAYAGYLYAAAGNALSAALTLRHYDYPTVDRRYDELAASLSWRNVVRATVTASPDTPPPLYRPYNPYSPYSRDGGAMAFSYEVVGQAPLPLGLHVQAGVGYYDLHRQIGYGYAYGSAGLGYQWRTWQLDVRYVATDNGIRRLYPLAAAPRLLASILWTF